MHYLKTFLLVVIIFTSFLLQAEEVRMIKLSGKQIENILNSRRVNFLKPHQGGYQLFYRSGVTIQVNQQTTYGEWKVVDNQFCSIWTYSIDWECYQVYGGPLPNGSWKLTWVGEDRSRYSAYVLTKTKKR